MYYIIYKITNLLTNQEYVGSHKTKNINDTYYGSGSLIKKALKEFKKENFKKEILEHFETHIDAIKMEGFYIKKFNTLYPNGYNINPDGTTYLGTHKLSEEGKEIISKAASLYFKDKTYVELYGNEKADQLKELRKNQLIKNIPITEGKEHPKFGKTHSIDSINKQKESINKYYNNNNKYKFELIDPDGKLYTTNNLSEFCRINNLSQPHLSEVAKGTRKHYKKWTCRKIIL